MKTLLVPLFVLVALLPPLPSPAWGAPSDAIARLGAGSTLRIEARDLGRVEGRLTRTLPDTLFVQSEGHERGISTNNIDGIWERGKATKTGAIVGGVAGGIGFGILAALLCEVLSFDPGTTKCSDMAIAGGIGGMVIGGGVGAAVGASIPKWRLRYRSTSGGD